MYYFIQLLSKDVVFVDSLSPSLTDQNPSFIFPLAFSKKTLAVTVESTPSERSMCLSPIILSMVIVLFEASIYGVN